MSQARSGELKAELGRQGPNAKTALGESVNALGQSDSLLSRPSLRLAMRRVPDSLAFGWPPDRGPCLKRPTGGVCAIAARASSPARTRTSLSASPALPRRAVGAERMSP